MDKAILKKFAIESRQDLMEKISNKIKTFYIDEDFKSEQKGDLYILSNEKHTLSLTSEVYKKRELLIKRVKELSLEQVIEEAAYTWFNRIIAIRYMEINDMLPLTKDNQSLGIRVLSSKDNTPDPEILKFTNLMNPDLDIDFKKEKFIELKDDNEKFKYVLLLVCRKLGRVIPQVFDGVTDYIDILIPDNLLNDTGFITKVINEVPENNYNQVEIIGWLYQYYNQTEKDRVINAKNIYKKNEIPYATQLFTPNWIVKYIVENTLGRYWVEHSQNDKISNKWNYFINNNLEKKEIIKPEEISVIDPCCGSGHILVYAFEVLYQIYESEGYNKNDIVEIILKNNLYGLDIDDRAGQLSVLSILLKAREYDKKIFNKNIIKELNIFSIQESNTISESIIDYVNNDTHKGYVSELMKQFRNAKEFGSLISLENIDYTDLIEKIKNDNTIFGIELREKIIPLIKNAQLLSKKYNIVITNPPYMNNSLMNKELKNYVAANYNDFKIDLFSAFFIRMFNMCKKNGLIGTLSPYVWMFISSYEKLRTYIIDNKNILSLIRLEYNSFEGACVPVATFVFRNFKSTENGTYIDLSNFVGYEMQDKKTLEGIKNDVDYKYSKNINEFNIIPGKTIAYWLSKSITELFLNSKKVSDIGEPKQGIATSDNNRFLRKWYEVNINRTLLQSNNINECKSTKVKWYPYNKGGEYRKWYGNIDLVVNWENDGYEIKNFKDENGKLKSRPQNLQYMFREGITWTLLSSSYFGCRYLPIGNISDINGMTLFVNEEKNIYYTLGLFCSKVFITILKAINPTLAFQSGDISRVPYIYKENNRIEELVKENIAISKNEWDSFETSWNYKRHPLIPKGISSSNGLYIEATFENWKEICETNFKNLKNNEEELNAIFIDIYNLNDELSKEVDEKDITIRKADRIREVKSLISYAVGCMFGRYSLNKEGLIYAGGDFDEVYKKYKKADGGWAGASLSNYKILNDNGNEIELSFEVDNDNVIPITDEAYFGDDIVERFKTFIKTVYGDNTFNENMDFIAETLGKKGTETSEETLRRYFVNDFFNDHCKIYQKRPIYWLLDSGKKNGFKALVYMHRYNENLIPKARLDYLHRVQTTYEKLLSDVNYKLTTDLSMTDKKEAKNRQADLNAKLNEVKEYDEKIAHIANQRISIDLDDGVKVNYEKFKDILAKIK